MKRKVFSLLALCLFAFLGMANAQTSGVVNANPDPIDLGYRPLGAWMRPLQVQLTATGAAQAITAIEADKDFFIIDANLPGTVSGTAPFNFTVSHGEANEGAINGNLVVMTDSRRAFLFDIHGVAYSPITADVVETAPTITLPFTATVGENIYDNYLLPGNNASGKDVIYKMNVADDILFSANVEGANGQVALYTEDFNGEPGPGADNNFTGIVPSGASGGVFEAQIGEVGSSTSGYFPFYTLYNYSIAENLFLASELAEAGVTTTPMASLSWYANNETGYEQKNISIWMGNVADTELATTSLSTANMTLVYTGNVTPVVGWNEFVFNQNNFAWDGASNIVICVQRSNGAWNSTVYWKTHNPGFYGQAYAYNDNNAYDMSAATYTLSRSNSYRASTIFKSQGRDGGMVTANIDGMTLTPGVYYLAASSTDEEFTVNAYGDVLPEPEQAYNPAPADGDVDVSSPLTLTWTFGEYTTAYRVLLGTTYPPTEVVVDWTNELSNGYYTGELLNNRNYFWRVDEKNSNGITLGQVWGFTTTFNVPDGLTAENEKIYEGDALNLSWNAVSDRSYRGYNVYQDGEKINSQVLTTPAFTVNGLTYNMVGYTFNVTAVYDEGESNLSNTLVAYVSGNGTVSGKVCELDGVTGIGNVEVSFEGVDEFQRPVSYAFTTSANGNYTGTMKAGNYTAMALNDNYQGVEYDGNILITYNQNTPNINFILQENLYPVTEVIAEEMSETQVKVYWSQGMMSELLEDFETGDFSSFNWVNDPTYPWAIVNGGVEGSNYCMKSTNEGINSSSSSIEVNVEIGRDGLMSFYHKISSESNYDKGYFYLDGSEKMNTSGAGNWQQKEYPITAGVHNFKWTYSKDSSLGNNDDCWYVDNISFIHDAEPVTPAEPGWVYYDNGENEDAIGTGGGQFSWGVMFPAGSYTGNTVTKVMAYDYMAMTGTVTIYNDGVSAPANAVGEMNVTFNGSEQFVEFTFSSPVSIDPTKNLWVIFYNASGATYPAAVCANTGDANGRWVSLDGVVWEDLATYDLDYTFMIRAFVAPGKGEVQEIMVNNPHTGGTLANAGIAKGNGTRAFNHYNIYRATEGNEAQAELITSMTDTVFFDNEIATLAPGVYKWGVSRVYEGNRGNREVIESQNFESGVLGNWTSLDADGDGYEWYVLLNSQTENDLPGHNNSDGHATSASYQSVALHPDNYLVSPQVELGGEITFYACAQDAAWASEKFGVAVSTTNNTSASAFTMLQTWTMTAKSVGQPTDDTRSGNRAQGTWYEYTVDLSNYAGQTGYVAIRHYDCTDWFRLNVDDIVITGGQSTPPTPPTPPIPPITGGNESEIVWSNTIEHAMYVTTTVDVLNNAAESPEGATITMTNISEPGLNLVYTNTFDETGHYVWESMRRGTYNVVVSQQGFETVEETVVIDEDKYLRYVLTEIIESVGDLYVSGTGWAMFGNIPAPTPVDPVNPDDPVDPIEGTTYDFDNSTMQGWTTIDADGDGFTWTLGSVAMSTGYGHNGSTDMVLSKSYDNNYGALTPDNYFVSPQIALGGGISFYACAQDASWASEHFGVAVSTSTATASAFTTIQEWTLTSKGERYEGMRGTRDQGNWYQFTVDLSNYAGQTGYVAIRHFNCTDMFYIDVDDISLGGGQGPTPPPTPSANVRGVEIFRDGEWIAEVLAPAQTYTDIEPGEVGEYEIRVVYNGNTEDYTHYTMSCPEIVVPAEFECLAPENLTGSYEYFNDNNFGALINWTYEGEVNASENYYDNGNMESAIGTNGGQFWWGVMFPAGSYQGSSVVSASAYDYMAMTGTVSVYSGGTNAPQTLITSKNVTLTGSGSFVEVVFDTPVEIDPSQNLWIIFFNESGATYPAAVCANTGDANGRWVSLDGVEWDDLAALGLSYTFMVRANTSDNVYFQVFRDGQKIADVPYSDADIHTYFDQVAIGNYQYQVNVVTSECESDFALTPDLSQNYVEINVTSVTENADTRIYPNPTTGIVNIEASGMSHITVVNALGQIVFDTNISGDQYQMNLGQFQAGLYMLRITTESGVSVQRVTVAK